jgi:hypothetical protein
VTKQARKYSENLRCVLERLLPVANHAAMRSSLLRHSGDHECFIQKLMWESFRDSFYRNSTHLLTEYLLKTGLMQVFPARDYLHTECKLVSQMRRIPAPRIVALLTHLWQTSKATIFFKRQRKFAEGMPVYVPYGSNGRRLLAEPYKVMLKTEYGYPVDI